MSDKTPNSLEPVKKVNIAKMSKWPLYAFLFFVLLLLAVLVYSVNYAHSQDKEQAGTPKVDIREEEKPLLMGEGKGLALPPVGSPAIAQPDKTPSRPEPLIVVRDNKQEPDQYQREMENIRRMKIQAQLTALSAPLGVKTASSATQSAPANRLVFPDGSAFTLGAMPGSDMAGYAGYTDQVNNHYLRIFGSAVLMSMISGGMAYTMDSLDNSNSGSDSPTLQNEMGSALAAQLGQTTTQLLQKNLNIKPTLEIRPGYQFNVIVTKDLVFQQPYTARR